MTRVATFRGRPVEEAEYRGRKVRYVADQLIVKLKPECSLDPNAKKNLLDSLPKGSTLESGFDKLGMAVVNLPPMVNVLELARALESQGTVQFAEPNFLDSAC